MGHSRWYSGYSVSKQYFSPTYSSSIKTTPPTCFRGCPAFFTFGLSCQEEISAQEEAFGQVQREGLWGMESPLKPASHGDGLTQIFPFQKYAQSSKARVSCRHGCDKSSRKTENRNTAAISLRETSNLCAASQPPGLSLFGHLPVGTPGTLVGVEPGAHWGQFLSQ